MGCYHIILAIGGKSRRLYWMRLSGKNKLQNISLAGKKICLYVQPWVQVIGRIYIYTGSVVQYWWSCTPSQSIGLVFGSARFLCWKPLVVFFGFINCVLLYDNETNTRVIVTIGIRFKQHFVYRYFTFCNLSPPRMCLSLDLLSKYDIQHGTIRPLMSHLDTQLGYSRGEFQALQLILLAAFGVVD